MKKIITTALIIISAVFLTLTILVMVLGIKSHQSNELFFVFNHTFSVVPTPSMVGESEDSIDPGDIVIIERSSFYDVEIGDVIVFQSEFTIDNESKSILVIHRVIGFHIDGGFVTQGDNNDMPDSNPVTIENFQGEFHSRITFLKPLVNIMLNSRSMIFIALFLVLASLLLAELLQIHKNFKKLKTEQIKGKHQKDIKEIKIQNYNEVYKKIRKEEIEKQKAPKEPKN